MTWQARPTRTQQRYRQRIEAALTLEPQTAAELAKNLRLKPHLVNTELRVLERQLYAVDGVLQIDGGWVRVG